MHIYQPYEPLSDKPGTLHLMLSDARERMLFVYNRAIPLILFFFVWYSLQQAGTRIPMGLLYAILGFTAVAIPALFSKSYVSEIKITDGNIYFVRKGVTGSKEINLPVATITAVQLKIKRTRRGGAFFTLLTNQQKQYTFLHIPTAYLDEKHTLLIAETLKQLLGVEVKQV